MKIDVSKLKRGDLLQIRHSGQPAVYIGSVQEKEAALLVVYLLGQYIVFDEHGVPQAHDFSERLDMGAEDRQEIDWRLMPVGALAKDPDSGKVLAFAGSVQTDGTPYFYIGGQIRETVTGNPYRMTVANPSLIGSPPRPWFGGECPVDPGIRVGLWLRNLNHYEDAAGQRVWECTGGSLDIVAYQIIAQPGERSGV